MVGNGDAFLDTRRVVLQAFLQELALNSFIGPADAVLVAFLFDQATSWDILVEAGRLATLPCGASWAEFVAELPPVVVVGGGGCNVGGAAPRSTAVNVVDVAVLRQLCAGLEGMQAASVTVALIGC